MSAFDYPLQNEEARFDYKLVNQNGKLSEVSLNKKTRMLTLFDSKQQTDECRKVAISVPTQDDEEEINAKLEQGSLQKASRKRIAGDLDDTQMEHLAPYDDMISSDTDSVVQASATSSVSNHVGGHNHTYTDPHSNFHAQANSFFNSLPPTKKRLTSNSDHLHMHGVPTSHIDAGENSLNPLKSSANSTTALTNTANTTNQVSTETLTAPASLSSSSSSSSSSSTTTTTSSSSGISQSYHAPNTQGSARSAVSTPGLVNRDHVRKARTPTQVNSPTHTPELESEEDHFQQLPLPSPSASPIQLDSEGDVAGGAVVVSSATSTGTGMKKSPRTQSKKLNLDIIESHMSVVPGTQSELLHTIANLSNFLTESNQNYLIFKLLQRTNRSTLSTFNGLIHNSLRRDLIGNLPFEIAMKVLSYLDYKTLLSLGQVCKKWFQIINNADIWTNLLKKDKLITSDAIIKYELNFKDQLMQEWCTMPYDINAVQVLYKKRKMIVNRWLDPNFQPKRISVTGHGNKVVTCLQHDEEKIVTGVDDKCILIYSTKTGQLLKVLEGHEGGVWALKYCGNTLVTGSTDRTVRVWNMKTGKCTHIFRGHTSTIRCLDIIQPTVIGEDSNGKEIVFPEYPLLVTGSRDHNIHVWRLPILSDDDNDANDKLDEPPFEGGELDNPYLIAILSGHTQSVRSISGCGNIIISGSYDSTVRVWDLLDNGNCKHILQGHQDRVYSTAMDFKRKICFSGSMDSTINIWNFETGELLKILEGHSSLVGLLALVDDVLVSAAADATLRIWDPVTGELRSKLKGHAAAITCFEHDGLKVVSGSEKMLKLWDVEKGAFARDLLNDVTGGIWQVRIDYKRCVAAVQRFNSDDEGETFIEILDFSEPPKF
ncbi:cell division control protein 4 [Lodderomyces elongisporus NRRL YB-4239]|uniref:Cell division control protein 4 n=1 Tax=Lodderomyces elongisporus (strain ATCC 11503 / CBS 2605 / JCM 1781 / NBRC 1676 / NRRL YB-4239) TaxID=379508 RepID=A5DS69_LODEL|nr:cell division control protein 4 [Lodderomyces elongisporus NRRL YB-4239]